jgi:hypothetical protein
VSSPDDEISPSTDAAEFLAQHQQIRVLLSEGLLHLNFQLSKNPRGLVRLPFQYRQIAQSFLGPECLPVFFAVEADIEP